MKVFPCHGLISLTLWKMLRKKKTALFLLCTAKMRAERFQRIRLLISCYHSIRVWGFSCLQYYYQATTLDPNFILAHFGLGQLHIYKGELNQVGGIVVFLLKTRGFEAISSFETVIQHYPNNVETLKILGSLYAHSDIKNQVNIASCLLAAEQFLLLVFIVRFLD